MQQLPKNLTLADTQVKWASILNPLLSNPALASIVLESISLATGANVINHKLGRRLQGWKIVRMRNNFSQVYDTQDANPTPQLTLNLNASADVVVDLEVF